MFCVEMGGFLCDLDSFCGWEMVVVCLFGELVLEIYVK